MAPPPSLLFPLRPFLLVFVFYSHVGQKLPSLDWIIHHGIVGSLLLSLDGEQRVVADLGGRVARAVGVLERHETLLPGRLLQLLVLRTLDQVVDASLAQEVALGLLRRAGLSIGRALVHPVDSVHALLPAGGFQLALELLLCALLLDLVEALLGALALGQGLLLFIVDRRLVALQPRVERLFEVEVAAAHFDSRSYS